MVVGARGRRGEVAELLADEMGEESRYVDGAREALIPSLVGVLGERGISLSLCDSPVLSCCADGDEGRLTTLTMLEIAKGVVTVPHADALARADTDGHPLNAELSV
jgi:hypothetical protein